MSASAPDVRLNAEMLKYLDDLADGDATFVIEILSTFADQSHQLMIDARAFAIAGDGDALCRMVHMLGGGARGIGATRIGDLCRTLEERLRESSESDEHTSALLFEIGEECQALEREISARFRAN